MARCRSCSSSWVTRIVLSSPTAALAPATIRISPVLEDLVEVERVGVAQERVDLAGGDEPLELVARRVERLGGPAAVADQGGELVVPVVAGEVGARDGVQARIARSR